MSFQFKQFTVHHDRCTMKVGTDAVLLGAWTKVADAERMLDIGTGSGIIALMLAQRSSDNVHIDAVEIELQDAEQAKENFLNSPWPHRISIHQVSIQQFESEMKYDVIVSNPPYFMNSYKPPDKKRISTRHTTSLNFDKLIESIVRLLKSNGRFNVILPYEEGLKFKELAERNDVCCSRQWSFRSRKGKSVERLLMEFRLQPVEKEIGEIIHYLESDEWTNEYKSLTKDFYLKL